MVICEQVMTQYMDYRDAANKYDRRYDGISFHGIEHALLTFTGSNSNNRVLEVGCGTGHWLAILEGHGLQVSGMDSSPEMLQQARTHVMSGDLKQGYADKIPWENGTFDQLFCINAVHHFERKSHFLLEAYRVLNPGGGLLIVGLDPHKARDQWFVYDYFDGVLEHDLRRYLSTSALERLMEEAGFSDCQTVEAQHMAMHFPARKAIEDGLLDKTIVSQLGILPQADFDRGLQRIWKDITDAEAKGEQAVLVVDLWLYATMGWKRSQIISRE
jgi:ubiquinone/menaquinone biosynthesis C-methylase UbiE